MIDPVLEHIEITDSDREEILGTNKVDNMVDIVKNVDMAKLTPESMYSTFFQSRSRIQLTQIRFKLIKYGDYKREQAGELIGYKDVIADIANIPVIEDNNWLIFKNNVEYA